MSMDRIMELLGKHAGLASQSIGTAAIERAVRHCMKESGLDDVGAYYRLAHTSPERLEDLIESVVVRETWFYRQPESFQYLQERLTKGMLLHTPERKLHVLSIGCSSGEEPYSVAMTLLDMGFRSDCFRIDAVDISNKALAAARRAGYRSRSFHGDDLAFRDRYFSLEDDDYVLKASVCKTVVFAQGNVAAPPFVAADVKYEVIFCRHVLIYMNPAARDKVILAIVGSLAPDGVVFVGSTEMGELRHRGFRAAGPRAALAFQIDATSCTPAGVHPGTSRAAGGRARAPAPAAPIPSPRPTRASMAFRGRQGLRGAPVSTTHASTAEPGEKSSGPDLCWLRIGIHGDSSCRQLTQHGNCSNCPTYSTYGRTFLDRPPPAGYIESWQSIVAQPEKNEDSSKHEQVVIFRLGHELFAFPTAFVVGIDTPRKIHRLPHRSSRVLLGLANLSGDLRPCVSLHDLLGQQTDASGAGAANRRVYPRMISIGKAAAAWVFPVDEVLGVHLLCWDDVSPETPGDTASAGYSKRRVTWNNQSVSWLDEGLLLSSLERSIR